MTLKTAIHSHSLLCTKHRKCVDRDSLALSTQHLHELVAFMYDHFDEFKLILCRAEGTGYADFIEVLVELEVDRSEEYYSHLRKNGMLSGSMTRQLHHMITRAYFTAVCETIVHDVPREEAMKYVDELAIFFHSGWYALATVPLSAAIYFAWLMRSILVGRAGFEPAVFPMSRFYRPLASASLHTDPYWLQGRESNPHRAAYEAVALPIDYPAWCWRKGSNLRPADYRSAALPTELPQQMVIPAGFEPGISGVRVLRPDQLD